MKSILALLYVAIANTCSGDTLRISELAEAAGDGAEQMVLKIEDTEEVFWVKKKILLGDSDIEEAAPHRGGGGQIYVKLKEVGGKKLTEATAGMQHGRDRLAVIIEGRLISVPVVQSRLSRHFNISGFQDLSFGELDDLARKVSGRPARPEGEEPDPVKHAAKRETVPFTEEEYQRIKTMNEKMGIFYLDTLPGEEDLDQLLRKGMSRDDVQKLFGKPHRVWNKTRNDSFRMFYHIAPEKRPENPNREMLPDGFAADFANGKLARWSHTYSDAPREEKVVGREPATLKVVLPEVDFSSDDVDLIAFIESIKIPDPQQSVNKRDLWDLLATGMMLSNVLEDETEILSLDANCDFMKTLSHHFPEIAASRKEAEDGRLRVDRLIELLSPYIYGEKEIPLKKEPLGIHQE